MSEVPANAALIMDRGIPLGNSEDVFLRRALHVKIGNKATEAIPVFIAPPPPPPTFFLDSQSTTTPGSALTLINHTVSGGTKNLTQVLITCRMEGKFTIEIDGSIIGSGRTGASTPQVTFGFSPSRAVTNGQILKVIHTARSSSPAVDIEAYVQGTA